MSLIKVIDFKSLGDERGSLISLEQNKNIPFEVKRIYYIFNTQKGVSRGFHAHRHLEQIAICVKGSCRFILDDGNTREEVLLDSPTKGLYINNNKWREMHDFSEDCVLMVLASEYYDESDYIRDYPDFIKHVKGVQKMKKLILEKFNESLEQTGKTVQFDTLNDDAVLLETGLDSLDFAILVTLLEEELDLDPFQLMDEPVYPTTFGEFVAIYEKFNV